MSALLVPDANRDGERDKTHDRRDPRENRRHVEISGPVQNRRRRQERDERARWVRLRTPSATSSASTAPSE